MSTNTSIEQLTHDLINYAGVYVYPEYYSHTDKLMWKINNPWTDYKEDKIVLSPVEEGLEKALALALPMLAQKEIEYLK